jgi:hypothetical protein
MPSRSFLCYSKISKNPSIPSVSHHPFFFKILKHLLKMFLTFPPPPTFEGRAPSEIVKRIVLV